MTFYRIHSTTFGSLIGVLGFIGCYIFGGKRPDPKRESLEIFSKKLLDLFISRALMYSRRALGIHWIAVYAAQPFFPNSVSLIIVLQFKTVDLDSETLL